MMKGPTKDIEKNIIFNAAKQSWDCGLCKKTFKERKDLEQHLNSGAHGTVRFSCAECNKGFASLGALTLHIEQAGHIEKNKKFIEEVERVALSLKDGTLNYQSRDMSSSFSPMNYLNSRFADPYSHSMAPYSNTTNITEPTSNIWICGYTNEYHLVGAGSFSIKDDGSQVPKVEESFLVHLYEKGSVQPEYESLCKSMLKALDMNLRNVRIKTSNETLYLHFTEGLIPNTRADYQTFEHLVSQSQKLFSKFNQVEIDYVPSYCVRQLYQKAYDVANKFINTQSSGIGGEFMNSSYLSSQIPHKINSSSIKLTSAVVPSPLPVPVPLPLPVPLQSKTMNNNPYSYSSPMMTPSTSSPSLHVHMNKVHIDSTTIKPIGYPTMNKTSPFDYLHSHIDSATTSTTHNNNNNNNRYNRDLSTPSNSNTTTSNNSSTSTYPMNPMTPMSRIPPGKTASTLFASDSLFSDKNMNINTTSTHTSYMSTLSAFDPELVKMDNYTTTTSSETSTIISTSSTSHPYKVM